MKKTIQRLINAIKNGKFAWEKYSGRVCYSWHGLYIFTEPLFCSYGQIGYSVMIMGTDFLYQRHIATITHDWEKDKTELTYTNF